MKKTLNIKDEFFDRLVVAMEGLYEIPIHYEGESLVRIPDFSPEQWVFECIKNYAKSTVRRYEQSQARKLLETIIIDEDSIT